MTISSKAKCRARSRVLNSKRRARDRVSNSKHRGRSWSWMRSRLKTQRQHSF